MAPSKKTTKAANADTVPEADDQPVASSSKTTSTQNAVASPEAEQGAMALMRMSQEEHSKKPEKEKMTAANFDPDELPPVLHRMWHAIEEGMARGEQWKRESAAARAARNRDFEDTHGPRSFDKIPKRCCKTDDL